MRSMKNSIILFKLGLAFTSLAVPALAQDPFQTIKLAGTVVADNKTGLLGHFSSLFKPAAS